MDKTSESTPQHKDKVEIINILISIYEETYM